MSSPKKTIVTPLIKKFGLDQDTFSNYRPVSNLSFISKLIEKLVSIQLIAHLVANNLYESFQSAYRSPHSTETALLRVLNDLLMCVDTHGAAMLILLDLSAAFDTIDHNVLLHALESQCGITGTALEWFRSYLVDRVQAIKVNWCLSSFLNLLYGVPQGSVLGPILFTIYTSPLGTIIRRHGLHVHFYADDSQLYIAFKPKDLMSRDAAITKIEACAQDIRAWMSNNFLKLNESKTEFIIITSKRTSIDAFSIHIGDNVINPTADDADPPRNLGVNFDSKLSFEFHVKKVTQSINGQLFKIGKIRKYVDQDTCATLINGLAISRMDYCNSVLYGLPDNLLNKLQLQQNRAARILTFTPKFSHISHVLHGLHWLPVKFRIMYKILLFAFKSQHGLAPKYLCDLIRPYVPPRSLRSQNLHLLDQPKSRLKTDSW